MPGLDVETLGLNVTVRFTPGERLEEVGAGGTRGVVSVAGMVGVCVDGFVWSRGWDPVRL